MKKHILYITILFPLFAWSCSNSFLDSEPMTQLSEQSYYKTPQDAWETLVGCYNQLSGGYGDFFQSLNIASDECFGGGGKNDAYGNQIWDEYSIYGGDLEINRYVWGGSTTSGRFFRAIRRCTVLTEVLDGIDWGSDATLRTRYEAEARFLRAYFLFSMQVAFGYIPLNKTSQELNAKQTDPHEVYKYIVADLKFAIANLPTTKFTDAPKDEFGRVTKWAAMAYLSRVYMFYSGYYADSRVAAKFGGVQDIGVTKAEVLANLEALITGSGHALVPRFGSLWPFSKRADYHKDPTLSYAGEYNPEIVFSIRHSTARRNQHPQYMGLRGVPTTGAYDPFWDGYGMGTINPKAFDQYESGDERRFASIIDVENEFSSADIREALAKDQREYTGYFQKKYQTLTSAAGSKVSDPMASGGTNNNQNYQDLFIIRYADVLLMAAELGSSNALNYVNQIRDRAFNDQAHRVSSVDIDVIYAERSREFVCEQIRWYDLLRRGLDYAKQEIDCDLPNTIVQNTMTGGNKVINFPLEKLGLLRIPESQILVSEGQLIQNPGW